jgi:hypothetical protein
VSVRDDTRLAIPRVPSDSCGPRGFDSIGYGTADVEEDGRMGVPGTLALLIVLNAGFAFGLLLRAGAAFWSTHKIARLFARTVHVDQLTRRPDGAGREASSEGAARTGSLEPTATMASRDLAKESFRHSHRQQYCVAHPRQPLDYFCRYSAVEVAIVRAARR